MALITFLRALGCIALIPFLTSALVILPEAFRDLKVHHPNRPAQQAIQPSSPTSTITPLPLVIWHGLGDSFDADGIKETAKFAEDIIPGTYIHLIQLGDTGSSDRSATFFGNLTEQVEYVCNQLAKDNILRTAPAINALGFSQGGQFLRAYVERCNFPPVRNLVTFGSQHNGISDFQGCESALDLVCQTANALLKLGTWSQFVQSRLIPAQYFRDPEHLDAYLESSNFLADVNNERAVKNTTYAENIAKLNKFVMYMFADDKTVIPKQSAWFAEYNKTSKVVTPLAERKMYKEDWIGLRKLAEKDGLVFDLLQGEHMRFSEKDLKRVLQGYFGPVRIDGNGDISDNLDSTEVAQDEL
jgi:palmitoyl-protein thioesterase